MGKNFKIYRVANKKIKKIYIVTLVNPWITEKIFLIHPLANTRIVELLIFRIKPSEVLKRNNWLGRFEKYV